MSTHKVLQINPDNVEYGTPSIILTYCKILLGTIDLDPSSNEYWNSRVEAKKYFTKEDNGLTKEWYGNVFLNHPFGKKEKKCKPYCTKKRCLERGYCITEDVPGNEDWINKFISEYEKGSVKQGLNICYSSVGEKWYKPLLRYPTCFLFPRYNYVDPIGETKGVQKGSSVTYLGWKVSDFSYLFSNIGEVMIPSSIVH